MTFRMLNERLQNDHLFDQSKYKISDSCDIIITKLQWTNLIDAKQVAKKFENLTTKYNKHPHTGSEPSKID